MKRVFHIICVMAGLAMMSSCLGLLSQSNNGWEKDYYAYQIGAIINGKEYHEYLDTPKWWFDVNPHKCGFKCEIKDSLVLISEESITYCWADSDRKEKFCLDVNIVADTLPLVSGLEFYFDGTKRTFNWKLAFAREEWDSLSPLPLVSGIMSTVPKVDDYSLYRVKDGYIHFSSFDALGYNSDMVFFDFVAENIGGEVLEVKNGYYKSFIKDY